MRRTIFIVLLLTWAAAPAAGQEPPVRPRTPQRPQPAVPQEQGFDRHLFPPELVMRHRQQLGLSQGQRETITEIIQSLQNLVLEVQWDLEDQERQLGELLERATIDEAAALSQIDRVLELEGRIKRAHLTALLRIKNALSGEQQQRLRELRRMPRRPPGR